MADADPLRHEPHPLETERNQRRHAVAAAASDVSTPSSASVRMRLARLAAVALVGVGIVAVASRMWSQDSATVPQPTPTPTEIGAEQTFTPNDGGTGGGPVVQQDVTPPPEVREETPALEFRPTLEAPRILDPDPAFPPSGDMVRQGGPFRVGDGVRPPRKIFDVSPVYPEEARAAGEQGVVILEVIIGEDGSIIEAVVMRSLPLLDQAALDAVTQWRFEPPVLNGEPAAVVMTVTVNFQLAD